MKFKRWMAIAFATLAITLQLSAQDKLKSGHRHANYTVVDIGTLGGSNTYLPSYFDILTNQGSAVGTSETTVADPYPYCFGNQSSCFVYHAFFYDGRRLKDLGALPGVNSSIGYGLNDHGDVAGFSENGSLDPMTGYPEMHAVLWRDGNIVDLGTLGGTVSLGRTVNNHGQVVGAAANDIPDPYGAGLGPCYTWNCWPITTQLRAFRWQHGTMQDLGTLGGNDAAGFYVNDRGQVSGISFTNTTPSPTTGVPTQDPFLWDNGRMFDVGSLGGTSGFPWWMNQRGQIVGQSNLAGDQTSHAFLWDRNTLTDLGTLGGTLSAAYWVNENGAATGAANLTGDQTYHGVLWKRGKSIDLGDLPGFPRTTGISINAQEQIVGNIATADFSVFHAMLWEDGSMIDLNVFVPAGSGIILQQGDAINERGEILVNGQDANGDARAYLLRPSGDCDDDCEQRIAESQSRAATMKPGTTGTLPPTVGRPSGWLRSLNRVRIPANGLAVSEN